MQRFRGLEGYSSSDCRLGNFLVIKINLYIYLDLFALILLMTRWTAIGPGWPDWSDWPWLGLIGPDWPCFALIGPHRPWLAPICPWLVPIGPDWPDNIPCWSNLAPLTLNTLICPQLATIGNHRDHFKRNWKHLNSTQLSSSMIT